MAPENTTDDADFKIARPPIKAAAILLGIFIGMYLAVAGIVRGLTLPDAIAAITLDSSMTPSADDAASTSPAGAVESPTRESLGQGLERTDSARECKPSAAIDSACLYN